MRFRLCCAAIVTLSTGCAVRQTGPATWRMTGRLLLPPGVAAETPQSKFTAPIAGKSKCAPNDAIALQVKRSRLTVAVNREALLKQSRGWLTTWAEQAEAQGCVAPGMSSALATRVVESVALPTGSELRLLRVDGSPNFVEISAGMRLQAVSPIVRPGGSMDAALGLEKVTQVGGGLSVDLKSSSDLLGFETAWYDVRPKASGGGSQIVVAAAETSIGGRVERQAAPAKNLFAFAPELGFYRLFYKADQSEVVVAAPKRAALPENADICDRPGGAVCLAVPRGVGLNPYLVVDVNGKPVMVSTGSDFRALLRNQRLTAEQVLPTLAITRIWNGKAVALEFDRNKQDVLSLFLTGKESLRW